MHAASCGYKREGEEETASWAEGIGFIGDRLGITRSVALISWQAESNLHREYIKCGAWAGEIMIRGLMIEESSGPWVILHKEEVGWLGTQETS
jgi:hypothetical protein